MKQNTAFFGILLKPTLIGLGEYYKTSESLLETAKANDRARIDDEVHKLIKDSSLTSDEAFAEWELLIQPHKATYDMLFTNFFRYSFIILATLLLEDHLNKFCCALHDVKGYSKAPPNPRNDAINCYKNYINEAGISIDNSLWDFIDDLRYIRNCIVHSSGDISLSSKQRQERLVSISKKGIGIHISWRANHNELTPLYLDDNMIMIESSYCISVVKTITSILEALCKASHLPTRIKFENNQFIFDSDE